MSSVLVVEDEKDARDLLVRGLNRLGFTASGASDGQEAAGLLEKSWDVIVTDLVMPRMDGLQFLGEINQRSPASIRIVVTSFADKDRVIAVLNLGADYLLEKPFSAQQLADLIAKLSAERKSKTDHLGQFFERRLRSTSLTERERALVAHVLHGASNKEIARLMGNTEQTVKNALSVVYAKLGVSSRSELFHAIFPI